MKYNAFSPKQEIKITRNRLNHSVMGIYNNKTPVQFHFEVSETESDSETNYNIRQRKMPNKIKYVDSEGSQESPKNSGRNNYI